MTDPCVRNIGEVEDMDGARLDVGVDYDTVTVCGYRLTSVQAEEFAQLFLAACWQAGQQAGRMAAEGEIQGEVTRT